MNTINIVIGPAGCGKSTYIKKMAKPEDVIISSDDIREEIYGNSEIQGNPRLIFTIFHGRIAQALVEGKNVWADATNIDVRSRKDYFAYGKGNNIVGHIIPISINECKKQNLSRDRQVPEYVIDRMYKNIVMPTIEEHFSKIIVAYRDKNSYKTFPYINGFSYIDLVK